MVGEGTRGRRERRREGGSKVMVGEGTRGGLCVLFVRWMTLFYVMAIMAWVYTYDMDSVHNGEPERSRVTI